MFGRKSSIPLRRNQVEKTAMSIQKEVVVKQPQKNTLKDTFDQKNIGKVVYNGNDIKLHKLAQEMIDMADPADQTAIAYITLPVTPFRKRVLVFKQLTYCIANWSGDKFPNVIYIVCDQVEGFSTVQANSSVCVPTNRVAALQLTEFVATMDEAQQRTYDLKYESKQPQSWSTESSQFTFRLFADAEILPIELPLPNPISLNMEIRTQ